VLLHARVVTHLRMAIHDRTRIGIWQLTSSRYHAAARHSAVSPASPYPSPQTISVPSFLPTIPIWGAGKNDSSRTAPAAQECKKLRISHEQRLLNVFFLMSRVERVGFSTHQHFAEEGKVMKQIKLLFQSTLEAINSAIAVALCLVLVVSADPVSFAITPQSQAPAPAPAPASEAKIPNDQLDSLVAPIALYPDPLLSQILVASTYPLEIVQLGQWMQKNSKMPKEKMAEEVKKEQWDPSVQGLVVLPDVVKNLSENIKWTDDLGNAFLAQQNDLMDAVQRMRAKAKQSGNLKTTEQQKVETKVVETKEVIIIQPATTEVIYVPSYNPMVVYGPPVYPYPAYPYPPPGAYAAGMAISFGVGMMVGAAWHGGYGYHAGWGGNNNITVNRNNNYVNNSNRQNYQGGARNQRNSNWQHNPQHRGGAPYSNQAAAQKYGGTARGDSMSTRQANARQAQSQTGGRQQAGASNRSNTGAQAGNRGASASTMNRGGGGAFGGSGGSSRASATASSSRGSSSMGGSRGGRSRGGGGRRR
jgi:uncharacterized membrane protein YgcG